MTATSEDRIVVLDQVVDVPDDVEGSMPLLRD